MNKPMLGSTKALLREAKQGQRTAFYINPELTHGGDQKEKGKDRYRMTEESTWWVPDPRTGIYYPRGHEQVIKDVPQGAGSFQQTYWLRSFDGVDKPAASEASANDMFDHPFLDM